MGRPVDYAASAKHALHLCEANWSSKCNSALRGLSIRSCGVKNLV